MQIYNTVIIMRITRSSAREKFELIAVQGYPRSSTLVPIVDRKRICNFLLVISSNFGRISLVPFSRYRRIKLENSLFSPPHLCLTPPLRGTRQNFWIKLIPQKLDWATLWWKLHDPITWTIFDWSTRVTDRQTDRRAIAYTRYSICLLYTSPSPRG